MTAQPNFNLRPRQASQYLMETHNVSRTPSTLAKLRSVGAGPRFRKVGRFIFYVVEDLDDWIEEQTIICRSTSEATYLTCSTYCHDPKVQNEVLLLD